jgi:hypothetical protein
MISFDFWYFNATFSNISAISWRPVLVVEEAGTSFIKKKHNCFCRQPAVLDRKTHKEGGTSVQKT